MEIHPNAGQTLLEATIPPPPEYLDLSEENGDRLLEKTQNAVGTGYIAAVLAGGVYGSVESLITGPSGSLKLRFYGMMSGFSRRGLKLANASSVVRLFFFAIKMFKNNHFCSAVLSFIPYIIYKNCKSKTRR